VGALHILTDHYEWHQEDLDDIGNEQPEHERHRGIDLQSRWRKPIPAAPNCSTSKDYDEEPSAAGQNCINSV
jgi:hypothetical protein